MSAQAESRSWTVRVRRAVFSAFPPEQLLPEHQPAYVSSWVYVFGVLTLASLIAVVSSGIVLVIFGPTWWHVSSIGHFVNSLHLWSAEMFFFFMAIHLWGKFFMAAWRGRRALTWMAGAICFLASIATAFTGYLSQQNFDSQWISTQAKDGLNASGIGAYFNVLNFGQMLVWHVILLPLALILLVIAHILLVRRRGICPPFPAKEPSSPAPENPGYPRSPDPAVEWSGAKRRYDLIKELVSALGVVVLAAVIFSALFSSPDEKAVTAARWANANPTDFLTTAVAELDEDERRRHLRTALHPHPGRRADSHRVVLARAPGRRSYPNRHRSGLRDRPARHREQERPTAGGGAHLLSAPPPPLSAASGPAPTRRLSTAFRFAAGLPS